MSAWTKSFEELKNSCVPPVASEQSSSGRIEGLKSFSSDEHDFNFSFLNFNFSILPFFNFKYTGLSGMKKLIIRNRAAGTVSAQNIQRQPQITFQACASATEVSRASNIFTTCAARMPSTMVIWFRLTMRPRMAVGLTSAIYIGDKADATPMPTPPTKRAMLNMVKSLNSPVPTADTVKSTAAVVKRGLRP